ncbi:hypothetical protein [Microbaculum sp. FT89]|uniref:hypothetical protein n=1 Tax=Microbaculum sp. FT89 TaxID=3447298 RepID=UPI003F539924
MNNTLLGNIAGAWRLAVDYVRDKRQAARTMREFNALDPHEASRILAETGMDASDLRDAVSRPFAFEDLMAKGMVSVGIDPDAFAVQDSDWFRDLQRTCAMCRQRGHCRQVIAHSAFAERFHDFCPNSGDFDRILAAGAIGSAATERPAYLN